MHKFNSLTNYYIYNILILQMYYKRCNLSEFVDILLPDTQCFWVLKRFVFIILIKDFS